jgi:uncharacterized damage-inducible protein DinB
MALDEAQFFEDTGYSWGSLQRECVHVMNGERHWISRAGGVTVEPLQFDDFPTREAVRARWDTIEAEVRAFLATLTAEKLTADVTYPTRNGDPVTNQVWRILVHCANHGTVHRAEMLSMIHRLGGPTIDVSFMQYCVRMGVVSAM